MSGPTALDARPRLVGKAVLRYDEVRRTHVLLLPERVVRLNPSAAAILARSDGSATVAEIAATLAAEFDTSNDVTSDVAAFLTDAAGHGWIET